MDPSKVNHENQESHSPDKPTSTSCDSADGANKPPNASTEQNPGTTADEPSSLQNHLSGRVMGITMKTYYLGGLAILTLGFCYLIVSHTIFMSSGTPDDSLGSLVGNAHQQTTQSMGISKAGSSATPFDRFVTEETSNPSKQGDDGIQAVALKGPVNNSETLNSNGKQTSDVSDEMMVQERQVEPLHPKIGPVSLNPDSLKKLEDLHRRETEPLRRKIASLQKEFEKLHSRTLARISSLEKTLNQSREEVRDRLSTIQRDRSYLGGRMDELIRSMNEVRERQVSEERRMKNWRLIAIGPSRAVIQGPGGETHQVKNGERVGGMKILSIQPNRQLVRTSQGTILRR